MSRWAQEAIRVLVMAAKRVEVGSSLESEIVLVMYQTGQSRRSVERRMQKARENRRWAVVSDLGLPEGKEGYGG